MFDKTKTYEMLKDKGIWHEITEHGSVFTMQELQAIKLPYPDCDAKNLFVRDQNAKCFYLITVKGDKRVDLNAFRKDNGLPRLSFASAEELERYLSLTPGSVGPLGLLNDEETKVAFYIDKQLLGGKEIIGVHPNDNTATVWLKTPDLLDIISEHGNRVQIVDIPEKE